jgi:hypothetical protein
MSPVDDAQRLELFQSGLDRLVAHLEQDGRIVYLVQDNPRFAFNPSHLMLNQLVWPRRVLAGLLGNSALGSNPASRRRMDPPTS